MERTSKKSYPNSVLKLYIKLYCKRRNSSKYKMMDAIKSWVSLNKIEREQFVMKYKECQLNHKKKLAEYLSKTQPFLKKKDQNRALQRETKRKSRIMEIYNENIANVESITDNHITELQNSSQSLDEPVVDSEFPNIIDLHEKTHCDFYKPDSPKSTSNVFEQQSDGILAEPAPPNILCAKDLFVIIKSRNGESIDTWPSLTGTQKSRYQKAVSLLKEGYIRKFKAYLESLPPKVLFDYYNNYFN